LRLRSRRLVFCQAHRFRNRGQLKDGSGGSEARRFIFVRHCDNAAEAGGRPATLKLGYYPLPLTEAERLRKFLVYPAQAFAALDPCTGEGTALVTLTEQAEGYRYGIELDTYRATQARAVTNETIHGSCFYTQCPVESSSLVYCNPPYSSDWPETHTRRMEVLFLEHNYRWLKAGGVLVLVIPGARLAECVRSLRLTSGVRVFYRLTAPESVRYKQVVVFGIRRSHREREKLRDQDI